MSYSSYDGIIVVKAGRGKDAPYCAVDISAIVSPGLSGQEMINALITKYGEDVIADIVWSGYKVVIQKPGQAILKTDPEDRKTAAEAVYARADSDLAPVRKKAEPKVTLAEFEKAARLAGIKPDKIESILAELLAKRSD